MVIWLSSSNRCLVGFMMGFLLYLGNDGVKKREANAEDGAD